MLILDLTAAFGTLDHSSNFYLKHCVGIRGTALDWFRSYLPVRSFSVYLGNSVSSLVPLQCGVPQGHVLWLIFFCIYLLPLGSIFRKYGILYLSYADNTQVNLPLKLKSPNYLKLLLDCLKSWMSQNVLSFNEAKTEVLVFGPSGPGDVPQFDLGSLADVKITAKKSGCDV